MSGQKEYSVPSRFPSSNRKFKLKTLSQFEESQINRNQELEHQLKMVSKQNEKLNSLNQYLQTTLNKRNEVIFEERQLYKTKQIVSPQKSNSTSKRQSQQFHSRKNSMPYFTQTSRLQYVGEEYFRLNQVLEINISDEEAISYFENDPNIKFVRQLDEDTFVQIAEEQNIKKLLQIHDHILKLQNFLKEMFEAILKFKKIIKASYQMNQQAQLNDAINCIVDQTQQLMNCERATCYIVDETKGEIWSRVAQGLNSIIRMPIDKGVAGFVAFRKESVNIPNAYADDRFNRESDLINHFKTQSILAAPIIGDNNQCLGVLQCLNKNQGVFTNEDSAYLKYICNFSKTVLNHSLNQNQVESTQNKLRHVIKYFLDIVQIEDPWKIISITERVLKKIMNCEEARLVLKINGSVHYIKHGIQSEISEFLGIFKKVIDTQCNESTLNNNSNPFFDPTLDIDTQMPVITMSINQNSAFQVLNLKGVNKKQSQQSHSAFVSGLELEMLEYIRSILLIKLK
ncbi:unnamed protein product [Paramecium pentaurelia]|uniref:GAF domain-containing protein n=1 Tax=Paramecium pentaurelia TaxID=43138 RepID=A0A8S1SVC6_9CILI|nr:unnamed protein product [Paramecium pentaurelia]